MGIFFSGKWWQYLKQFTGILATTLYSLIIRIFGEAGTLEINSISYLVITPIVLGYIPFFLKDGKFLESILRVIFYPIISILLFLTICVITGLEDLLCYVIIGWPYIVFSILVSLLLRIVITEVNDRPTKNSIPVLLIPLAFGAIEKSFPKQKTEKYISREIVVNCSRETIWKNLEEVPDLSTVIDRNIYTYMGVPTPRYSTYDRKSNTRLGYFDQGVVLHESIIDSTEFQSLTFKINLDKSQFSGNPTVSHIVGQKNLEFHTIRYQLVKLNEKQTKLILSTSFAVYSNIPFYANFWSDRIIGDFEHKLLQALKRTIETAN